MVFFPAAIAYAIVKHNLFDVDVYIKRTLGYTIMTALVGSAYFMMQVLFRAAIFQPLFGEFSEQVYPVLLALLVVFFFSPTQVMANEAPRERAFRVGGLVEQGSVASLVLLVMEKSPDIAILKTMGAPARSVMAVFMLQGLVIGAVGTLIGASAGFGIATVLDRYQLIRVPMDVYQIAYVPFVIETPDLALVVAIAIVICFVATIYPSRQAARLEPVDALRFG